MAGVVAVAGVNDATADHLRSPSLRDAKYLRPGSSFDVRDIRAMCRLDERLVYSVTLSARVV
jgi:hypothetical protein